MAKSSQTDRDWSYEAAIVRVETLVKQIEAGDLDLADVFDRFDTASQDLQQCEQFLAEKQQQLDLAIETLGSTPDLA
jgi:exodeoxyribonuclease VII small subunit